MINFIMEIENLSFPEAVELLARRGRHGPARAGAGPGPAEAGTTLCSQPGRSAFSTSSRQAEGAAAADYMHRRGISAATARRFGLGCAPDGWEALVTAMKQKGYWSANSARPVLPSRGGAAACTTPSEIG